MEIRLAMLGLSVHDSSLLLFSLSRLIVQNSSIIMRVSAHPLILIAISIS